MVEEFVWFGQKMLYNYNDEINQRKSDYYNLMLELMVIEFEDVKFEILIENIELKQLLNMV